MMISLVLSVGAAIAYWLIARSIVVPLKELVGVSREVSRGKMDVEARGGGLLETRTLAETFNEMLRSLERHRSELEDAQPDHGPATGPGRGRKILHDGCP